MNHTLRTLLFASIVLFVSVQAQDCEAFCAGGGSTTYTLDSLVFSSRNAAVVAVSDDGRSSSVVKSIFGDLKPGDTVSMTKPEEIHPPLRNGQKLIVFVDPGGTTDGIYDVDDDDEVRRYFTNDIFCPDDADGWNIEPRDPRLPKLSAVEQQIGEVVETLPLIDALWRFLGGLPGTTQPLPPAVAKPAVLDLLKRKCGRHSEFDFLFGLDREVPQDTQTYSYLDRLAVSLSETDDPAFKFAAARLCPSLGIDYVMNGPDLRYLTAIYAANTQSPTDRILAIRSLRGIQLDMTPDAMSAAAEGGPGQATAIQPRDVHELYDTATGILQDEAENSIVRTLTVDLLENDVPAIHALFRKVYARTRQPALKHAIEGKILFKEGDAGYEALHPSNRPVSTFVHACPVENAAPKQLLGLTPSDGDKAEQRLSATLPFCAESIEETYVHHKCSQGSISSGRPETGRFVLTEARTGAGHVLAVGPRTREGTISDGQHVMYTIEDRIDLDRSTDLPPGDYRLSYDFECDGKVIGSSYPATIHVVSSSGANMLGPEQ